MLKESDKCFMLFNFESKNLIFNKTFKLTEFFFKSSNIFFSSRNYKSLIILGENRKFISNETITNWIVNNSFKSNLDKILLLS